MFDFAEEYAQTPERALHRLQFLLLHEDTCLARIALLQALAAAGGHTVSPRGAQAAVEGFRAALDLLCAEGLFSAHAGGRLTPERVRDLARLARDPDALWEAHH